MKDEDDLKKKIEALEQENRALRDAASRPGKRNIIVVSEGSYEGHPIIIIEPTSGRPFKMGLHKASLALHCIEQVKQFVTRHNAEIKDCEIIRGSDDGSEGGGKSDLQI